MKTKKQQIKELQEELKRVKDAYDGMYKETNTLIESLRKEKETSAYYKDLWEKQLNENCDKKQREDMLNNIACCLANAYIIAKAVNPQTNVRYDTDTMTENAILASVCAETAKAIMERVLKII